MNYRSFISALLLAGAAVAQCQAAGIEVVTEDSSYTYLREGKLAGPGTRIVEQTLQRAGEADYRTQLYPWARAYETALHEPNVLIYPILRTPARESLFKWVGELAQAPTRLYRLHSDMPGAPLSLQDASQAIVGVVRNDARHQYLQAQGFTRLVISANNRESFQKLLNRQIQIMPMSELEAKVLSQETRVGFEQLQAVGTLDDMQDHLYLAFSLATPDELVERVRRAFEQLRASGELARLMKE